jgi:transposase-like protein
MASIAAASEPLETCAAARRLGVSPYTLIKWRSQARGPVFGRRGRKVIYCTADLEAYELANRMPAQVGLPRTAESQLNAPALPPSQGVLA